MLNQHRFNVFVFSSLKVDPHTWPWIGGEIDQLHYMDLCQSALMKRKGSVMADNMHVYGIYQWPCHVINCAKSTATPIFFGDLTMHACAQTPWGKKGVIVQRRIIDVKMTCLSLYKNASFTPLVQSLS